MESSTPQPENTQPVTPSLDDSVLARLKAGANWFYWIAGLSLINSVIFAFGGDINFILGLAFTQIIDAVGDTTIAEGGPAALKIVAIAMNLILVAIFALFGYYANKAISTVFVVGMLIYVIDGLLWLVIGSYFAAAFHIYALFMIFRGLMASREIKQFNSENAVLVSGSDGVE